MQQNDGRMAAINKRQSMKIKNVALAVNEADCIMQFPLSLPEREIFQSASAYHLIFTWSASRQTTTERKTSQ